MFTEQFEMLDSFVLNSTPIRPIKGALLVVLKITNQKQVYTHMGSRAVWHSAEDVSSQNYVVTDMVSADLD